jgi:hypothetical protein
MFHDKNRRTSQKAKRKRQMAKVEEQIKWQIANFKNKLKQNYFSRIFGLSFRAERGISLWSFRSISAQGEIPGCHENACAEGTLECGSASYRLSAWDSRRQLRCRSPRRFAHFHARW